MKKLRFLIITQFILSGVVTIVSCNKIDSNKKGYVSFGANYDVINCITTVTVYIDDKKIGTLEEPTDSIGDCGEQNNITEELSIGEHSYKIMIEPLNNSGCSKTITGNFTISENQCKKIFIDYYEIFSK